MWPFSTIRKLRDERDMWQYHACARLGIMDSMRSRLDQEIEDLKASNERLADALAAAKERAGE